MADQKDYFHTESRNIDGSEGDLLCTVRAVDVESDEIENGSTLRSGDSCSNLFNTEESSGTSDATIASSSSSFSSSSSSSHPLKTIKEVIAFYYRYNPHSSDEESDDIDNDQINNVCQNPTPHGPQTNEIRSISVSNMKGKNAVISLRRDSFVSGNNNRAIIGKSAESGGEGGSAMRPSLPNRWPSSLPFMQHRFKFLFTPIYLFSSSMN